MANNSDAFLLEKGDVLNKKWEILEHIATGGMAEVYRARQINLDREVAVKVLSQKFLESFEGDGDEIQVALERFDREVKAMAQVRHPNVLQVYDHDSAVLKRNGGEVSIEYIAMEYIPGPSLRSTLLPEGVQTNEKEIRKWIRNYFLPILDGVEMVHSMGIVHRDLKPQNVLLDGSTPKITDFGLAGGKRWKSITQSHHIAGTAPYQAYEQFIDMGETDFRADIYSLGKILYEVVTGEMDKKPALFWKTARLPNPDTPFLKRLDRTIQQATAEDKNDRIPSIELLRQAILELLEEEPTPRFGWPFLKRLGTRNALLLMAVLVLIGVASVGLHMWYHRERSALSPPLVETSIPKSSDLPMSTPDTPSVAPLTVVGKDGITLRLIPAGRVVLPESFGPRAGTSIRVGHFYMDEIHVTNHQYVAFLNQILLRIRVERGVVMGDGNTWLHLGEVTKGYEPIVFRDGKFLIVNPAFHSLPVLRVTAYGASAYARFYGRRLPTEVEWFRAMTGKDKPLGEFSSLPHESSDMETMHRQMMDPSSVAQQAPTKHTIPVTDFEPNMYGIRGLGGNISEWALVSVKGSSPAKETPQYLVLPTVLSRHPFEGFENVGFRCVLSVPSKKD